MSRGLLISFEGLDGVGKTTQLTRLKDWFNDRRQEVLAVREPGGTALGEALRQLVLHRVEASSALAEFLTFAAARAELMESVVTPALERGAVVLMDRFIDSSVAYQAFGRGLDRDTVMYINQVVTQGRKPDMTIWLRGEPFPTSEADHMEQRTREYFERVDAGYQWLAEEDSERWLIVDSRQDEDAIVQVLQTHIELLMRSHRGGE